MVFIPKESLCNYINTKVYVAMVDGRKFSGTFKGFDNDNHIRLDDGIEKTYKSTYHIKGKFKSNEVKPNSLASVFLPIPLLSSVYTYDSALPDNVSQDSGEENAMKERDFCIYGHCESLSTGKSPLGSYVGPYRTAWGHLQREPFCNCICPFYVYGPGTTTPVPMAVRMYEENHFNPSSQDEPKDEIN